MISPLPYINRAKHLIQEEHQLELSPKALHDLTCAIYDFGAACAKQSEKENRQSKNELIQQAKMSRFIVDMKKYIEVNEL